MPRDGIPSRRFTLFDLMVLVAASAAGVAMLRPYMVTINGPNFRNSGHLRTMEATYGAWSLVAAWWMLALLVLQYRGPHPGRWRLARRPGHVACLVAMVALAVGGLHHLVQYVFQDESHRPFSCHQLWITASVHVGPTIAGTWLLLAMSGRWKSDPGWMDRLGRGLGWLWIAWRLFWLLPKAARIKLLPEGVWDGILS